MIQSQVTNQDASYVLCRTKFRHHCKLTQRTGRIFAAHGFHIHGLNTRDPSETRKDALGIPPSDGVSFVSVIVDYINSTHTMPLSPVTASDFKTIHSTIHEALNKVDPLELDEEYKVSLSMCKGYHAIMNGSERVSEPKSLIESAKIPFFSHLNFDSSKDLLLAMFLIDLSFELPRDEWNYIAQVLIKKSLSGKTVHNTGQISMAHPRSELINIVSHLRLMELDSHGLLQPPSEKAIKKPNRSNTRHFDGESDSDYSDLEHFNEMVEQNSFSAQSGRIRRKHHSAGPTPEDRVLDMIGHADDSSLPNDANRSESSQNESTLHKATESESSKHIHPHDTTTPERIERYKLSGMSMLQTQKTPSNSNMSNHQERMIGESPSPFENLLNQASILNRSDENTTRFTPGNQRVTFAHPPLFKDSIIDAIDMESNEAGIRDIAKKAVSGISKMISKGSSKVANVADNVSNKFRATDQQTPTIHYTHQENQVGRLTTTPPATPQHNTQQLTTQRSGIQQDRAPINQNTSRVSNDLNTHQASNGQRASTTTRPLPSLDESITRQGTTQRTSVNNQVQGVQRTPGQSSNLPRGTQTPPVRNTLPPIPQSSGGMTQTRNLPSQQRALVESNHSQKHNDRFKAVGDPFEYENVEWSEASRNLTHKQRPDIETHVRGITKSVHKPFTQKKPHDPMETESKEFIMGTQQDSPPSHEEKQVEKIDQSGTDHLVLPGSDSYRGEWIETPTLDQFIFEFNEDCGKISSQATNTQQFAGIGRMIAENLDSYIVQDFMIWLSESFNEDNLVCALLLESIIRVLNEGGKSVEDLSINGIRLLGELLSLSEPVGPLTIKSIERVALYCNQQQDTMSDTPELTDKSVRVSLLSWYLSRSMTPCPLRAAQVISSLRLTSSMKSAIADKVPDMLLAGLLNVFAELYDELDDKELIRIIPKYEANVPMINHSMRASKYTVRNESNSLVFYSREHGYRSDTIIPFVRDAISIIQSLYPGSGALIESLHRLVSGKLSEELTNCIEALIRIVLDIKQ